mmetsp:Transcript_6754/g.16589  ORF Transcript_6754/g.16589 Transcript_6754/m.16589 type:complete len:301 (-) Transcript_6754:235-1137(-)
MSVVDVAILPEASPGCRVERIRHVDDVQAAVAALAAHHVHSVRIVLVHYDVMGILDRKFLASVVHPVRVQLLAVQIAYAIRPGVDGQQSGQVEYLDPVVVALRSEVGEIPEDLHIVLKGQAIERRGRQEAQKQRFRIRDLQEVVPFPDAPDDEFPLVAAGPAPDIARQSRDFPCVGRHEGAEGKVRDEIDVLAREPRRRSPGAGGVRVIGAGQHPRLQFGHRGRGGVSDAIRRPLGGFCTDRRLVLAKKIVLVEEGRRRQVVDHAALAHPAAVEVDGVHRNPGGCRLGRKVAPEFVASFL